MKIAAVEKEARQREWHGWHSDAQPAGAHLAATRAGRLSADRGWRGRMGRGEAARAGLCHEEHELHRLPTGARLKVTVLGNASQKQGSVHCILTTKK